MWIMVLCIGVHWHRKIKYFWNGYVSYDKTCQKKEFLFYNFFKMLSTIIFRGRTRGHDTVMLEIWGRIEQFWFISIEHFYEYLKTCPFQKCSTFQWQFTLLCMRIKLIRFNSMEKITFFSDKNCYEVGLYIIWLCHCNLARFSFILVFFSLQKNHTLLIVILSEWIHSF